MTVISGPTRLSGRRCHAISPVAIQIPPMTLLTTFLGQAARPGKSKPCPSTTRAIAVAVAAAPATASATSSRRLIAPRRRARRAPHPTGRPCG